MKFTLLAAVGLSALTAGQAHAQSFAGGPPASARPGECYARIIRPAEYDAVPETVVTREGYDEMVASKPEFTAHDTQVVIKENGVRYEVRQPTWTTITETLVVKPAYDKLSITPAKFETRTETVTVGQPRMVWKKGANLSSVKKVDAKSGEVYCLVEEPAETQTFTRRVMVAPEQVQRVTVPAEIKTYTRQVMSDRGGVREIETPAQYKTMTVLELTRPAETSTRSIAPETRTIERLDLRKPERQDWVQVLCETNATVDRVVKLQTALMARGYYRGPIDGISGPATQKAVDAFEKANGIPHTGNVSMETLQRLGIEGGSPATSSSHELDGGRRGPHADTNTIYPDTEVVQDEDQLAGGPTRKGQGSAPAVMAAPAPSASAPRQYTGRKRLNWGQQN
jgi:peptidoglycan hydrolase-like protein with peptidoglycan-binding domain